MDLSIWLAWCSKMKENAWKRPESCEENFVKSSSFSHEVHTMYKRVNIRKFQIQMKKGKRDYDGYQAKVIISDVLNFILFFNSSIPGVKRSAYRYTVVGRMWWWNYWRICRTNYELNVNKIARRRRVKWITSHFPFAFPGNISRWRVYARILCSRVRISVTSTHPPIQSFFACIIKH